MKTSLRELAALFLKLGCLGFGGPAAHIAMLEDEVVTRRGWMTRESFLDLIGLTHLIPGPNSTEMAIHVGYERCGLRGLVVAGMCFIGPAVFITSLLAWAYVEYGSLPQVAPIMKGIQPVVVAVILGAVWKLGKSSATSWRRAGIGAAVILAASLGLDEVFALMGGGVLGMFVLIGFNKGKPHLPKSTKSAAVFFPLSPTWFASLGIGTTGGVAAATIGLWGLGWFFLKVGFVLYGGGYVLVAFLEGGLVAPGILSEGQLLDAIAVGQFTPGPILSTAAFIGFVLHGAQGAAVSSIGIFLPSFLFVLLAQKVLRQRRGPWFQAFLGSVNVSAVGLMAFALFRLAKLSLVDSPEGSLEFAVAWILAVAAAVALIRFKVHAGWLIAVGGAVGWILG